jgi:hypothetical protein
VSTEEIEGKLLGWVEEAMDLRHGEAHDPHGKVSLPAYELGQDAAVDMLQRVRQRLDRVEELQSMSRQALGRVLRLREQADFELSLKYDESIATNRNRYLEYQSADEKRADASLASLNEKRQQHQMKRLESHAKEALDVITQCYWGLANLREDILQMLRLHRGLTAEEVQT